MKPILARWLLFFAALLPASLHASRAAEQRDLILVAGQSNAVGFDAEAEALPADPHDKDIMFWWRCGDPPPDEHDSTSAGQWTSLQAQPRGNPLPASGRQFGNFKSSKGGFGPEIGFARALRAKEGKPLAIVKVAFSGTGMRIDWNSGPGNGGACYRALVRETKAAIAAAASQGITLHLRAIVWVQGESDANRTDAPNYERALGAMIGALRSELGAPQLIALLGFNTRFPSNKQDRAAVVAAQQSLAAKDKRCAYVDTEGAETLLPTEVHFTAAGTLEVGRRFAAALLKLEANAEAK